MSTSTIKKLLVVLGLAGLAILIAGFGVGVVFADEPVVVTDGRGNDVFAIFAQDASAQCSLSTDEPVEECEDCECPTGYAPCRRSDCPCGASWQDCECVRLVAGPCVCRCWCLCDPCDAVATLGYGGIGYAYATYGGWGTSYGRSVLGSVRVGFWGTSEAYREYRGWLRFPSANLPEDRSVEIATAVLEVDTQWLATDESTSLIVELVNAGPSWPRDYADLNWPVAVTELLRLTTLEVKEMVEYYGKPVRFTIPPSLLEERITQNRSLAVRFRFEGARENSLFDVDNADLYIKWAD